MSTFTFVRQKNLFSALLGSQFLISGIHFLDSTKPNLSLPPVSTPPLVIPPLSTPLLSIPPSIYPTTIPSHHYSTPQLVTSPLFIPPFIHPTIMHPITIYSITIRLYIHLNIGTLLTTVKGWQLADIYLQRWTYCSPYFIKKTIQLKIKGLVG